MLNNNTIAGIEISEEIKLATINWFTINRFPPDRSVTIGTAVTGGTALCNKIIMAM